MVRKLTEKRRKELSFFFFLMTVKKPKFSHIMTSRQKTMESDKNQAVFLKHKVSCLEHI